jgi:predicted secreted acid phosphatase
MHFETDKHLKRIATAMNFIEFGISNSAAASFFFASFREST